MPLILSSGGGGVGGRNRKRSGVRTLCSGLLAEPCRERIGPGGLLRADVPAPGR